MSVKVGFRSWARVLLYSMVEQIRGEDATNVTGLVSGEWFERVAGRTGRQEGDAFNAPFV